MHAIARVAIDEEIDRGRSVAGTDITYTPYLPSLMLHRFRCRQGHRPLRTIFRTVVDWSGERDHSAKPPGDICIGCHTRIRERIDHSQSLHILEQLVQRAGVDVLMLPDVVVLDLSHDELSPSRTSGLLGQWITASTLLCCLPLPLQSSLLPRNPNGNFLPVVLLEHTLAITGTNHTIKAANPRTTIDRSLTIVGILPHALGAAKPRPMTMAIVEVAVAAVQCRRGRELTVATVCRRLGAQLTVLCIHVGI